ncbi:MAG: AarF/ABC1/UbiB kinase family protein [Deltaproteobacteria bacterium]|nr:AarF/ABC1/UbiB kinase family protein [Deltaproteobacteria bacterium]
MSIFSAVRDLDRLRQITQVLVRHGFGAFAAKMGLPGAKLEGVSEEQLLADRVQLGKRLRLTLQDLGTTFIKLGQIVSTRPDVIPEEIVSELKKLQDDVPPFDSAVAKEQVAAELGAPLEELFTTFADAPMACASVAQVYRAEVTDSAGTTEQVAVKVQRPGIDATVQRDLNLLHHLARVLEKTIPEAQIYSPSGLVREFERAILAELDFTTEAENAAAFVANFTDDATVCFPRILPKLSSRKVLTMEYLDGVKVDEAVKRGADGAWLAKNALRLILKMVFEDGFFHADPHPGNILILPAPPSGGYGADSKLQIGLLDLGLVGRLSPELRDRTVDLLLAAAQNDADALADALLAIGKAQRQIDHDAFREYVREVAARHLGKPMAEMEAAAILGDLVKGALKFEIEIPATLTMLFRTIITVEGVGKEIYPELDVLAEAKPYLLKILAARYHPMKLARGIWRDLHQLSDSARGLPRRIQDLIDELQRGNLKIEARDRPRARALERLGRRLRASGIFIGSAGASTALLIADRHQSLAEWLLIGGAAWLIFHLLLDWHHQRDD